MEPKYANCNSYMYIVGASMWDDLYMYLIISWFFALDMYLMSLYRLVQFRHQAFNNLSSWGSVECRRSISLCIGSYICVHLFMIECVHTYSWASGDSLTCDVHRPTCMYIYPCRHLAQGDLSFIAQNHLHGSGAKLEGNQSLVIPFANQVVC